MLYRSMFDIILSINTIRFQNFIGWCQMLGFRRDHFRQRLLAKAFTAQRVTFSSEVTFEDGDASN